MFTKRRKSLSASRNKLVTIVVDMYRAAGFMHMKGCFR